MMQRVLLALGALALGFTLAACSNTESASDSTSKGSDKAHVSLADLTPKMARRMSEPEARRWLRKWTRQSNSEALETMDGYWVPQISSKCTGLAVDIAGGKPNGSVDTTNVSNAEILAFHLALRDNYTAINTEWSALSDDATSGPCAGKDVWIALVPNTYTKPQQALAYCARNDFPYGECAARYLDANGSTKMFLPGELPSRSPDPQKQPEQHTSPPTDSGRMPADEDPAVRLSKEQAQVFNMFLNIQKKEIFCNTYLRNPSAAWDLMKANIQANPDYSAVTERGMQKEMTPLCSEYLHDLYGR